MIISDIFKSKNSLFMTFIWQKIVPISFTMVTYLKILIFKILILIFKIVMLPSAIILLISLKKVGLFFQN